MLCLFAYTYIYADPNAAGSGYGMNQYPSSPRLIVRPLSGGEKGRIVRLHFYWWEPLLFSVML